MNSDGSLNMGQLFQKVPPASTPDSIAKLHKVVSDCNTIVNIRSDTCEAAAQFYVCLQNQKNSIGIDLRNILT